MRRYLRAFGPALPADLATWSRLTGFREVLERMRPTLRVFADEHGRELFDVPDGELPGPGHPGTRPLPPRVRQRRAVPRRPQPATRRDDLAALAGDGPVHGTVLVDGMIAGTWAVTGGRDRRTLTVRHLPVARRDAEQIGAEGERLLRFLEPDAPSIDVAVVAVG